MLSSDYPKQYFTLFDFTVLATPKKTSELKFQTNQNWTFGRSVTSSQNNVKTEFSTGSNL